MSNIKINIYLSHAAELRAKGEAAKQRGDLLEADRFERLAASWERQVNEAEAKMAERGITVVRGEK